MSVVLLGAVGVFLSRNVVNGLLSAKERQAVAEASRGLLDAQQLVDASDASGPGRKVTLVDSVVTSLAARGGSPEVYEILLLAAPVARGGPGADAPERGTNLIDEASIPVLLREAVTTERRQSWTWTQVVYLDRRTEPGLVVGAPLDLPGVGTYELYYLFPLSAEAQTLQLVQRALLLGGGLLLVLLGLVAWLVTRNVVSPVRAAARTAERLSNGRLEERMRVHGEDDLARLALSFNQMAASLQRQIRQLEELSRVQRRFVSDVSHELRTPLTTIRMAADVLHDERADFDPAVARSAELLQTQLDRFEALLSDLLEISRIDAGAVVLDLDTVDMSDAVRRVVDTTSLLAARNGVQINAVLPPAPVLVECDPRRLDRILRNLVNNALEHGAGRPLDLTVAGDSAAVAVTVRDHGVGLRPGEAALVFNRFWRGDPSRARTIGGTGLGLAISLEDTRLHGGWLQAWGEPGDGANFRLTMPRYSAERLSASPLALEPADARARRGPLPGVRGNPPGPQPVAGPQ